MKIQLFNIFAYFVVYSFVHFIPFIEQYVLILYVAPKGGKMYQQSMVFKIFWVNINRKEVIVNGVRSAWLITITPADEINRYCSIENNLPGKPWLVYYRTQKYCKYRDTIHAIERSIISQGRHFGLDVGQQNRLLDRIGMVSGLIVIFPFHSY